MVEDNVKNNNIVAIIQARTASTRLPGKVLKRIKNKTLLEILICRIKKAKRVNSIVVATTKSRRDDKIERIAKRLEVSCFRGSANDVLKRFIDTSRAVDAEIVIRVTADNPLTEAYLIDRLVEGHLKNRADYTYCPKAPLGIGIEIVSRKVLERIYHLTNARVYKEHVTLYILKHPEAFRILSFKASDLGLDESQFRLTVDMSEDLKLFRRLSESLGSLENLETRSVIEFLKQHPEIAKINAQVKQKIPEVKHSITVIIRTYNSQRFVRRAINSVLNQDLPRSLYEILVVDNGSTDSTQQILRPYGRKIRLIEQKETGYVKAINYGLIHSDGKYIILLDADDTLQKELLSDMYGVLEKQKDLGFVYCDYYEKNLGANKTKLVSLKNIFNSVAGGIMFRKNILVEAGMYDERLIFPEYDLLIKMMRRCKGRHIPKPLFTYYRHKESLTADKARVKAGIRQLFAKYGPIKGLRRY